MKNISASKKSEVTITIDDQTFTLKEEDAVELWTSLGKALGKNISGNKGPSLDDFLRDYDPFKGGRVPLVPNIPQQPLRPFYSPNNIPPGQPFLGGGCTNTSLTPPDPYHLSGINPGHPVNDPDNN